MDIIGVERVKRINEFGVVYFEVHVFLDGLFEKLFMIIPISESIAMEKVSHLWNNLDLLYSILLD